MNDRRDIESALARLNALVGAKDNSVIEAFDDDAEVLLVGSELGEIAKGRHAIETFFTALFAAPVTIGWEWNRIDIGTEGATLWFFAEGRAVLDSAGEIKRLPYRLSGVLVRRNGALYWRQFHGSEPR